MHPLTPLGCLKMKSTFCEELMSIHARDLMQGWGKILRGKIPLLSIEITRECPLRCPGCYAYNDEHLAGGVLLRTLNDKRGDDLVKGIIETVRRHEPLHVSLVGGEPLVRHKELSRILPELSAMGVHTLVVTSAVIPIPMEWQNIRNLTVAVSVDGLPEHHDERRKPATYERILKNIEGRRVNIHWTITRPMLHRDSYLEEYVAFWNARPEVRSMWVSTYTPQIGELSNEMLSPADRAKVLQTLPALHERYSKCLFTESLAKAYTNPPKSPADCTFARMSANYTADLKTRVQPCIFGGNPDCSQCGCAISAGLHWISGLNPHKTIPFVTVGQLVRGSMTIGAVVNRALTDAPEAERWTQPAAKEKAAA
jgi:MoaA/NifB/PqqE/SkfB family radical SAM enzyme